MEEKINYETERIRFLVVCDINPLEIVNELMGEKDEILKHFAELTYIDFEEEERKKEGGITTTWLLKLKKDVFEVFANQLNIEPEKRIFFAVKLAGTSENLLKFVKPRLKKICGGNEETIRYLQETIRTLDKTTKLGCNARVELKTLTNRLNRKLNPIYSGKTYTTKRIERTNPGHRKGTNIGIY